MFYFYLIGSLFGLALWVYMIVKHSLIMKKRGYTSLKIIADFFIVCLASWLSIPFLLTTLYMIEDKPTPKWVSFLMSYLIVGYFFIRRALVAFKDGKHYN